MNNSLIVSALAMLALTSCNGKDDTQTAQGGLTIIDVDNPVVTDNPPIGDLIDTAFVVQFKGDDLLMQGAYNVQKSADRIIVSDPRTQEPIKFFDANGNFIRSLRSGNGPGEIDNIGDMFFDAKRQVLFVSNSQFWSIFDKDGNFKEQIQLPFQYGNMTRLGDEYVFWLFDYQRNDSIGTQLFVTDTAFCVTHKYFPMEDSKVPFVIVTDYIARSDDHVSVTRDTIYYYADSQLTPRYYYKYSERFDKNNFISVSSSEDFERIPGYMQSFIENSKTAVMKLAKFDNKNYKYAITDKKSGKSYVYSYYREGTGDESDLPVFFKSSWTGDDYFIIPTYDGIFDQLSDFKPFMSEADRKIIDNFQLDDNPILVFFRFKEF
ncbi:MAG: 6-bladed beta-propeller [Bacteroidales bacterium]|nr:6-bladed beta-propeller [Bacteroidales bacterium]